MLDTRIIDSQNWYRIKGATTAPNGMAWFNNGQSRFEPGYKSILLLDEGEGGMLTQIGCGYCVHENNCPERDSQINKALNGCPKYKHWSIK